MGLLGTIGVFLLGCLVAALLILWAVFTFSDFFGLGGSAACKDLLTEYGLDLNDVINQITQNATQATGNCHFVVVDEGGTTVSEFDVC